jgi:hypothetical protein
MYITKYLLIYLISVYNYYTKYILIYSMLTHIQRQFMLLDLVNTI